MSSETGDLSMPPFHDFGERPNEVAVPFENLAEGIVYRAWMKAGSCQLSFTSKLLKIEVEPIPASEEGKRTPFFFLRFESGVSLKSRRGWGVQFYAEGPKP